MLKPKMPKTAVRRPVVSDITGFKIARRRGASRVSRGGSKLRTCAHVRVRKRTDLRVRRDTRDTSMRRRIRELVSRIGDELEQARPVVRGPDVTGRFQHLEAVVDSIPRIAGFVDQHPLRRATVGEDIQNRLIRWAKFVRLHRLADRLCAAHVHNNHRDALIIVGPPIRNNCAVCTIVKVLANEHDFQQEGLQ